MVKEKEVVLQGNFPAELESLLTSSFGLPKGTIEIGNSNVGKKK